MTRDERWVLEEKYAGIETPAFAEDVRRLAEGEPVAYVIGSQPFLDLTIHLDSRPLIPRPETEWWTEHMLHTTSKKLEETVTERAEYDGASQSKFSAENYAAPLPFSSKQPFQFLDLCAGSGAIGCAALSRLPATKVYFGEIAPIHEATIWKNIAENGLDVQRADVRIGNLFEPFQNETFDLIAVNPPYIPQARTLPSSVRNYEPKQALYSGDDGLDLIRSIAKALPHHLRQDGMAWIECDNSHSRKAADLFIHAGMGAEIRTDQYGVERVILVRF